jgi:simple sugar transport system ATP-binding protein
VTSTPDDPEGTGTAGVPVPAVELRNITKTFGAVTACDQVDLMLHRGRIHGILGENGAGKSTLMKILIGLVLPDGGTITVDGRPVQIHDPLAAAALGIGMVHQHFSLVDALTVWENVALGDAGRLDPVAVRNRIGEIGEDYGLRIDPDARVGDLTAGLRQRVEIIKCLRRDPSIVIFDEPTSVLTLDESTQLFESFRDVVTKQGRAVVLVSHKLDEVLAATDEITIMRQGRVVENLPTAGTDARTLARDMVGREVSLRAERAALGLFEVDLDGDDEPVSASSSTQEGTDAPAVLSIRNATALGPQGVSLLDDLSLEVHAGEILGLAGVEGNGQRALGDLLSSLVQLTHGDVRVGDHVVSTRRPGAMASAGISVIPEDRHDSGVVLDMTVAENLVLVDPHAVAKHGIIDSAKLDSLSRELSEEFEIQCTGPSAPLWSLSGGNQQRVVLARELSHRPKVLVAAQPTRGLDVGAIEYMTDRLRAAAADGVGVLLISNELEEILDLADRIAVMYRGRIVGEMTRADADLERLSLLMGGAVA